MATEKWEMEITIQQAEIFPLSVKDSITLYTLYTSTAGNKINSIFWKVRILILESRPILI